MTQQSVLPRGYLEGGQPPDRRRRRGSSPSARRRRRRIIQVLLVIPTLIVLFFVWGFAGALTTPGNSSFPAKFADWMRQHDAAFLSTTAEKILYSLTAPKKGGQIKHLNALPKTTGSSGTTTHTVRRVVPHLAAPSPVPLVVHPAAPGEGQWKPVGPIVDGFHGMYEAQFRADTVYTSEITSAVWIDPKLMRMSLIPGLTDPGGTWPHPPHITHSELPSIAAAFNGGFLFTDAHGGFYLDGKTGIPLRAGAASLVVYKDGAVNIGAWGQQVHMTPNVKGVLQNLVLLVNNGQVSASATYNDSTVWGATLGPSPVVPRSGIGITADGALVYVAGPALTARTLAESLQRAGAVRAMTLDMNPEWVTFNFYNHPVPSNPYDVTGTALYPQQQRPADRYLPPTAESRDFIEVATRNLGPSTATGKGLHISPAG